jgi:Holliday junction resolvasome RuvABC endonuclease subunit
MNNSNNNIYIGFDFSMNKPAATIYFNKHVYFYFWPLNMTKPQREAFSKSGIRVTDRNLPSIKTKETDSSQLTLIHTIRSTELANMIIKNIDELIESFNLSDDYDLYVCSEGLSMASKGDATLNLATYKGVLLSKIYEHYPNLKRLFTYAPNTLKSTAGCAVKALSKDKINMIKSFMKENINSPFKTSLIDGTLKAEISYYPGVDDICDSYWAFKTMIKKENLPY